MAFQNSLENARGHRFSTNFKIANLDRAIRQYSGGRDREGNGLININGSFRSLMP